MSRWKLFAQPFLAIALIAPLATATASPSDKGSDVFYCGGETTRARVDAYFDKLKRLVGSGAPPIEFDQFVGERFSTLKNDRYLVFKKDDVSPVTPARISRDDWREIAKRGVDEIRDAGWRGCMLNHGRVWFETDGESFYLRAINHDIRWAD